jgi:hypothetical protein
MPRLFSVIADNSPGSPGTSVPEKRMTPCARRSLAHLRRLLSRSLPEPANGRARGGTERGCIDGRALP